MKTLQVYNEIYYAGDPKTSQCRSWNSIMFKVILCASEHICLIV